MSPDTLPTPDCGLALDRIERSLGAGLTDVEQRQLDDHLATCGFCAESKRDAAVVRGRGNETGTILPALGCGIKRRPSGKDFARGANSFR